MEATRQERVLGKWMAFWAVAYAGGGLLFLFGGPQLEAVLRAAIERLFGASGSQIADSGGMWNSLTVSMMFTIAAASFLGGRDPVGKKDMALVVAVAKIVSSMAGVVLWARWRDPLDLVVPATDFPLFVANYVLWRAAARSRAGAPAAA